MVVFWLWRRMSMSQRCHKLVFPMSLLRPKTYNVVFSTSAFRHGINVAATSWFWSPFPDENLTVLQYHYNFIFPKTCSTWKKHNLFYMRQCKAFTQLENLQLVFWTEKRDFWSFVVHWSERAPCFLAVNSVGSWFNYFIRSANHNTRV